MGKDEIRSRLPRGSPRNFGDGGNMVIKFWRTREYEPVSGRASSVPSESLEQAAMRNKSGETLEKKGGLIQLFPYGPFTCI